MSVVAAAIVGSLVVGGATAYYTAESASDSADKAVDAQTEASNANLELQRELAASQREDYEPWRAAGAKALEQLQAGISENAYSMGDAETFDPASVDMELDPGYKFRMQQGVDAIDSSAASQGMLLSGAQQKALNEYGQNLGSQEYSNAYSRSKDAYADTYAKDATEKARNFNMLSSLAGTGQVAASDQAGVTSSLASVSGNIISNNGRAEAQGALNQGQAQTNMYNDMAQTTNTAAQNWLTYKNLQPGA